MPALMKVALGRLVVMDSLASNDAATPYRLDKKVRAEAHSLRSDLNLRLMVAQWVRSPCHAQYLVATDFLPFSSVPGSFGYRITLTFEVELTPCPLT